MKVLYSVPKPSESSNPYTTMVARSAASFAEVSYFSWRTAWTHRFDVFHVHWPETLVRGRSRPMSALRLALGFGYLVKLRADRTKIVWTVHNVRPHEAGSMLERLFISRLMKSVDAKIYINESRENDDPSALTLLHGSYRDWIAETELAKPLDVDDRPTFIYFGMVRPYKGIESFVAAMDVAVVNHPSLTAAILGASPDPAYSAAIERQVRGRAHLKADLRRIPDGELYARILESEVVVLPYQQMYNSGSLILALSLGRHVLAPRTDATERLRAEFGAEWISLFEGPLAASHLSDALKAARAIHPGALPPFEARDWKDVGDRLRAIYGG